MNTTFLRFGAIALWAGALCALGAGCTSTTTTAADGSSATVKAANWDVIAASAKTGFKYATTILLAKNPAYSESVAAINAGVGSLLTGELTEASARASIAALAPQLSAADAATYASALMDVYDLITAATGQKTVLATDTQTRAVVQAISDGIAAGVALHAATAG